MAARPVRRVVLASGNPGKLRELRELLAPEGLDVVAQGALGIDGPEETGETFLDNALLKARHAARAAGLPAIADDSGIEVDALGGAPGVRSARYAGEGASDEANLATLLDALARTPDAARVARYRCAVVYVRSAEDARPLVGEASWEGRLLRAPRGRGGFGYDPIFEVPERKLTAAELEPAEKNALSHRGRALRALLVELRSAGEI